MLSSNIVQALVLAPFISYALADVDCNANITIGTMSQLEEVREECETIEGYLVLGANLTGHANLDGIRKINGDLDLFSCDEFRGSNCTFESGATATVSSSSLEDVGGSIRMDTPLATIEKILFPGLKRVGGSIDINDHGHLAELDISNLTETRELSLSNIPELEVLNITNLAAVESISIQSAAQLKRISSNGIRNVVLQGDDPDRKTGTIWITLESCPKLEEIGDLFAKDLTPHNSTVRFDIGSGRYGTGLPSLKEINLGWTNISSLWIGSAGGDVRVRLGNSDTDSIHIELAMAQPSTRFDRSDGLQNLTFGSLYLIPEGDSDQETIDFPFDRVGELIVRTDGLDGSAAVDKVWLPERALEWGLKNLTLDMKQTDFLVRDDDDNIIWHWPEDMHDVRLNGRIDQALIDMFIEGDRKVSGQFVVTSTNGGIDCQKFREDMKDRVGGWYNCLSLGDDDDGDDDDGAGAFRSQMHHVLGMSMIIGVFLGV